MTQSALSHISSAVYDAANQLSQWGATNLTYDENGNLTNDGTNTYAWNARNQLASISGGATASFVYDGLGRRQRKTVSGTPREFLYDGVNPVQETSGATVLANILTGLGVDEFLTRTEVPAGATSSFLTDALGSAIALADSAGVVQSEYTYEPFGKTTATGAANTNPFQYTGRENDGTGLYYYRARYYHPGLQRFISEDPIGTPAFLACPSQRDMLLRLVTSPAGGAITGGVPNPASITCDLICFGITSQVCQQQYPCPPPNSKSG